MRSPDSVYRDIFLLQSLFNSNSHGNGHTDHGVVTSAQEAHHFNAKSAFRRILCWYSMPSTYLLLNWDTHHLENDDVMIIWHKVKQVKPNHHKV